MKMRYVTAEIANYLRAAEGLYVSIPFEADFPDVEHRPQKMVRSVAGFPR